MAQQPYPAFGVPPANSAWVPTSVQPNNAPQVFIPPQVGLGV